MHLSKIADIEEWLARLRTLVEQGSCPCPIFLKPFHLATLAVAMVRAPCDLLRMPAFLESYAARMNLWGVLNLEPPLHPRTRDEHGRFLPLVRVESSLAVDRAAERIREIAENQHAGVQTLGSLEQLLGEVLDNCFSHAAIGPELPGFACAQAWPKAQLAQVAVADGGIGIRASLLENPVLSQQLQSENACAAATQRYLTGKPGKHSGYGLAMARELIEQNGGNIVIVSGHEAFRSSERGVSAGEMSVAWPGTLVVMEWRTNRPLDAGALFEAWAHDA